MLINEHALRHISVEKISGTATGHNGAPRSIKNIDIHYLLFKFNIVGDVSKWS